MTPPESIPDDLTQKAVKIYLGHLYASIEGLNKSLSEIEILCSLWLMDAAAAKAASSWSLSLHDAEIDGVSVGTPRAQITVTASTPDILSPQRKAWLMDDGASILEQANAIASRLAAVEEEADKPSWEYLAEAALKILWLSGNRRGLPDLKIRGLDHMGRSFSLLVDTEETRAPRS